MFILCNQYQYEIYNKLIGEIGIGLTDIPITHETYELEKKQGASWSGHRGR